MLTRLIRANTDPPGANKSLAEPAATTVATPSSTGAENLAAVAQPRNKKEGAMILFVHKA
jgi:hypothetical protein